MEPNIRVEQYEQVADRNKVCVWKAKLENSCKENRQCACEELLEACRSAEQDTPLAVAPFTPKSGRVVPICVEGEK